MLKKVLTTAVLAVSALSVITAHAAAAGAYISGQLGYANTHRQDQSSYNNFLARKAIFLSYPMHYSFDSKKLANNGLAGRLALGYQFNQNFALELGYLQLGQKKTDSFGTAKDGEGHPVSLNGSIQLNQYALDLAAKAILPLSEKFNVYGKLGVAYLTTTVETAGILQVKGKMFVSNHKDSNAEHQWAPEAALGVSYDITPNFSIDTSWTHIHPTGKDRLAKNIDFIAAGLSYNFG